MPLRGLNVYEVGDAFTDRNDESISVIPRYFQLRGYPRCGEGCGEPLLDRLPALKDTHLCEKGSRKGQLVRATLNFRDFRRFLALHRRTRLIILDEGKQPTDYRGAYFREWLAK